MWRSILRLNWFIREKHHVPSRRGFSLLIPSIFLPLVHSFWRLEYKNTDDKSIKGCFTFLSYFSMPDKSFFKAKFFFPPSLLHIICLHTEGFAFKGTHFFCFVFFWRKNSFGKQDYMTVISICPPTTADVTLLWKLFSIPFCSHVSLCCHCVCLSDAWICQRKYEFKVKDGVTLREKETVAT